MKDHQLPPSIDAGRRARRGRLVRAAVPALLAAALAWPAAAPAGATAADRPPGAALALASLTATPAAAREPAAASSAAAQSGRGAARWVASALLVAAVLTAVSGFGAHWVRMHAARPRRRRQLGPRAYALAARLGFRYDPRRRALVLRGVGERVGPVLRLRAMPPAATRRPPRHGPTRRTAAPPRTAPAAEARRPPRHEPTVRIATPPRSATPGTARRPLRHRPAARTAAPLRIATPTVVMPRPERVVDLDCRLLPQRHRGRAMWQLAAVDTRSGFAWAELVRPRDGTPSRMHVATFLRRVDGALAARGGRLHGVVVDPADDAPGSPARPAGALREGSRLAGAELVAPDGTPRPAAHLQETLAREFWRPRADTVARAPIAQLRDQLARWLAHRNGARGRG